MNQLELIEIEFRSKIAYQHAHQYGALGYRDSKNFESENLHKDFLEELDKQLNRSRSEPFIMHHRHKYGGEFPFWVAVEVISFGELSKLFSNLKKDIKKEIVKDFNIPSIYVKSWLHSLSYLRNICAHYGRLYGKKLIIKPILFKKDKKIISNSSLFSIIYVLCKLLHKDNLTNFIISLQTLLDEYANYIELKELGFPKDWEKMLN